MKRAAIAATVVVIASGVLALVPTTAHAKADTRPVMATQPCTPEQRTGSAISKSSPRTFARADLWVYGDSITWQSRRHLRGSLSMRTAVDAHWGRNTRSAVDALLADRRKHGAPELVVMATGTNDLGDIGAFRAQVVRARKILPKRTRLLWVDVYVDTSGKYRAANRAIRSVRGVKTLKWARLNLDRTRSTAGSPFLGDGIHVNARGCDERNELIRKAVDR